MPFELLDRIKESAKSERRTVSNWVALRCEEYLDAPHTPKSIIDAVAAAGKLLMEKDQRSDAADSAAGGAPQVVDPRTSATNPPKTQEKPKKSTG